MAILSSLIVKIGADAGGLDRELARSMRNVKSFGDNLGTIGQGLTLGITLPIIGIGTAALQAAGKMEQSKTAFTTLLGSAEKAKAMLGELQQFALKTPFEFQDLQQAAKRMMALGFAAKDIIPMLRTVGDAVSALGGGKEMIDRVTLAIGQMSAKGKVSAQEMNQLAEAGIPAWELLSKSIGVSIPEAMKMAEKGAISASVAIPAILEGMNAKFAGGMEAQSKTLLGQWSNVKDQIFKTLSDIGEAMLPAAKGIIDNFVSPVLKGIGEVAKGFGTLPDSIQSLVGSGVVLAASIGPTAWGISKLSAGVLAVQKTLMTFAAANPWLALGIGVATVAGAVWASLSKVNSKLDETFDKYEKWQKQNELAMEGWGRQAFTLEELKQKIQGGNTALSDFGRGFETNIRLVKGLTEEEAKLKAATDALTEGTDRFGVVMNAIQFKEKTSEGRLLVAEFERLIDVQNRLVSDIVKNRAIVGEAGWPNFGTAPDIMTAPDISKLPGPISAGGDVALEEAIKLREMLDKISTDSDLGGRNMDERWEGLKSKGSAAMKHVQQHVHQLSRSLGDAIVKAESLGDVFKKVAQSIASSLISLVIEKGINKVIGALGGLSGSLGGIFGGGAGAAAKIGGTAASSAGGIASAAGGLGGVGSSAGSAAGAAGGMGVSAAVGMVTGIVSAVSGVIGNFQMKGMNKSLDLIEKETRESKIHLFTLVGRANEFWPKLPAILDYFYEHQIGALAELIDAVRASGKGGNGNTLIFQVNGSAKDTAEAIVRELKLAGVKVG